MTSAATPTASAALSALSTLTWSSLLLRPQETDNLRRVSLADLIPDWPKLQHWNEV